ncbi:hypothetical protein [Allocoleopsis sp.]|uniref:hypothetical protein n=1 Tax=Allocoleopsis sp. TaxID=3088169 RepID=UPI002FD1AE1E
MSFPRLQPKRSVSALGEHPKGRATRPTAIWKPPCLFNTNPTGMMVSRIGKLGELLA